MTSISSVTSDSVINYINQSFDKKQRMIAGYSMMGKPIPMIRLGVGKKKILIIGGHHGTEIESIITPLFIADNLLNNISTFYHSVSIFILPMLNPDGLDGLSRTNANGVDLNRNYDTLNRGLFENPVRKPYGVTAFSEPETKAVKRLTTKNKFALILSYHANKNWIATNAYAGQFAEINQLAKNICRAVKYPFIDVGKLESKDITTVGDCITWFGEELSTPGMTIELRSEEPKKMFNSNMTIFDAILKHFSNTNKGESHIVNLKYSDFTRGFIQGYDRTKTEVKNLQNIMSIAPEGFVTYANITGMDIDKHIKYFYLLQQGNVKIVKRTRYDVGEIVVYVSKYYPFIIIAKVKSHITTKDFANILVSNLTSTIKRTDTEIKQDTIIGMLDKKSAVSIIKEFVKLFKTKLLYLLK